MPDYEREIAAGHAAERVLGDEAYRNAVAQVERDLFDLWRFSSWNDTDKREFIYRQLRAMRDVEDRLATAMNGGKVARSLLNKLFNRTN